MHRGQPRPESFAVTPLYAGGLEDGVQRRAVVPHYGCPAFAGTEKPIPIILDQLPAILVLERRFDKPSEGRRHRPGIQVLHGERHALLLLIPRNEFMPLVGDANAARRMPSSKASTRVRRDSIGRPSCSVSIRR